jgi:hypothetical protein
MWKACEPTSGELTIMVLQILDDDGINNPAALITDAVVLRARTVALPACHKTPTVGVFAVFLRSRCNRPRRRRAAE